MKGNFYLSVLFVLSFSIFINVKSYLDTKKALKTAKKIFFSTYRFMIYFPSEKHFFEKKCVIIVFDLFSGGLIEDLNSILINLVKTLKDF